MASGVLLRWPVWSAIVLIICIGQSLVHARRIRSRQTVLLEPRRDCDDYAVDFYNDVLKNYPDARKEWHLIEKERGMRNKTDRQFRTWFQRGCSVMEFGTRSEVAFPESMEYRSGIWNSIMSLAVNTVKKCFAFEDSVEVIPIGYSRANATSWDDFYKGCKLKMTAGRPFATELLKGGACKLKCRYAYPYMYESSICDESYRCPYLVERGEIRNDERCGGTYVIRNDYYRGPLVLVPPPEPPRRQAPPPEPREAAAAARPAAAAALAIQFNTGDGNVVKTFTYAPLGMTFTSREGERWTVNKVFGQAADLQVQVGWVITGIAGSPIVGKESPRLLEQFKQLALALPAEPPKDPIERKDPIKEMTKPYSDWKTKSKEEAFATVRDALVALKAEQPTNPEGAYKEFRLWITKQWHPDTVGRTNPEMNDLATEIFQELQAHKGSFPNPASSAST